MFCPVMPKPSKTWASDICWPSVTSLLSTVNEGTDGMKSYGNGGRSVMVHLRQYRGRLARHGRRYRGRLACHAYVIHGRARHGRQTLVPVGRTPGVLSGSHITVVNSGLGRERGCGAGDGRRSTAAAPSAHLMAPAPVPGTAVAVPPPRRRLI